MNSSGKGIQPDQFNQKIRIEFPSFSQKILHEDETETSSEEYLC